MFLVSSGNTFTKNTALSTFSTIQRRMDPSGPVVSRRIVTNILAANFNMKQNGIRAQRVGRSPFTNHGGSEVISDEGEAGMSWDDNDKVPRLQTQNPNILPLLFLLFPLLLRRPTTVPTVGNGHLPNIPARPPQPFQNPPLSIRHPTMAAGTQR